MNASNPSGNQDTSSGRTKQNKTQISFSAKDAFITNVDNIFKGRLRAQEKKHTSKTVTSAMIGMLWYYTR